MGQQGVWMHYGDMLIIFSPHRLYDGGMVRQKSHFLLWRIGREQGQIFSHTWHDVARVRDGTSIVQREAPPYWEDIYIYNIILGRVFDTTYVKELSFEMTVALLQRLAAMSLKSLDCMLKCSQDHFTSNAPWKHVEYGNKKVMDESIP